MSKRKKTTLAKLRAANRQIRGLRKRHAGEIEEADIYAEALLRACGDSVSAAYGYMNDERKKLAEAKRVAEMRRPNGKDVAHALASTINGLFDSARWKIAQHAVFFAERPNRSGFITGLTVPK